MLSQIIGSQSQRKLFKFFYGIQLPHKLYLTTGNLSKSLRKETMSATEGQRIAQLLIWKLIDFENFAKYINR